MEQRSAFLLVLVLTAIMAVSFLAQLYTRELGARLFQLF